MVIRPQRRSGDRHAQRRAHHRAIRQAQRQAQRQLQFQQRLRRLHAISTKYQRLLVITLVALATALHLSAPKGIAEPIQTQTLQSASLKLSWLPTLAQAIPPVLVAQGNQIILNGQTLPAAWSQRQQSIGISDSGLMQTVGVDLLNTTDATRQPVQWFSEPSTQPLVLESWLTSQSRYLDITQLAQQAGWQVQARGNALQINTPATRVVGVRQGRQDWGDRIVVDLDRATPWQVSEQGQEAIVTINGAIAPAMVQNFRPIPGTRLTSLNVAANGNQTVIRMGTNLRPRVWTLPNPNRLIIDIRSDSMVERDIAWAPGIRWRQQNVGVGNFVFPVVSLVVNPRQPGIALKPITSNPNAAMGTAPLLTTAQQQQAVAAINAGFFNRNNQLPLGAIRVDNRWISGPILNRGAIAWNDFGDVTAGRLSIQESLTTSTGQRLPVLLLNSGYVRAGVARYTPDWGGSYTPILNDEVIVTVQNNQVSSQQPSGVAGQRSIPIPSNGYLVVVRANGAAASALPVGTTVQVETVTSPSEFSRFPQVMGAGPLLVQNRQIVLNAEAEQFTPAFIQQAAARSAIGVLPDGNLILVSVHRRINGTGAGPTLNEIAQIMQRLGTVHALNLDGGSSTTLYLGGQLLDRSPRTAARVHNGIGVFMQPNLARIRP
ncbi:phosphodiester glycosidase family protein [Oculatella sp. LEGE 06141]|uniref:phosphodiester glycosidase family protein n=1 Tax=Oculatella sp. LEGE 06141 TaxID=1828648 RepID=UPI0030D974D3